VLFQDVSRLQGLIPIRNLECCYPVTIKHCGKSHRKSHLYIYIYIHIDTDIDIDMDIGYFRAEIDLHFVRMIRIRFLGDPLINRLR
jgi:hypothetical protein